MRKRHILKSGSSHAEKGMLLREVLGNAMIKRTPPSIVDDRVIGFALTPIPNISVTIQYTSEEQQRYDKAFDRLILKLFCRVWGYVRWDMSVFRQLGLFTNWLSFGNMRGLKTADIQRLRKRGKVNNIPCLRAVARAGGSLGYFTIPGALCSLGRRQHTHWARTH